MQPLVEIFRAGTHIDSAGVERTFTETDLDQMASSYNPAVHEAPFLVNHDETQPNQGLVDRVVRIGKSLFAQPKAVAAAFKSQINSRRLPALSAAFYHPQDPRNPHQGQWALRHVAAVQIPAVKGMQRPQFAEGDLSIAIQFSEPVIMSDTTAPSALSAEELQRREQALAAREALLDKAEFTQFAEGLLNEGKQFDKGKAIALFLCLPNAPESKVEFSETDKPQVREAFKQFLQGLPKSVEFGELAGGKVPDQKLSPTQIANKAQAYKAEQATKGFDVSYAEAVEHVMQEAGA